MRRRHEISALLVAFVFVGSSLPALPQEPEMTTDSREIISIFSGDVHIPRHVHQLGDVVVIGGRAKIEGRASQVVVILGDLELSGSVDGDVVSVLSDQRLDEANVDGQYVSVLGSLEMRESRIHGEFVNLLSGLERDSTSSSPLVSFGEWIPGLMALIFWALLLKLFLLFLLLVLIVALAPERVRLIGEEAPGHYGAAFFTGLLTYVAVAAIWVLVMVSFIGIPFFFIAYWPLKWLGIAGLFFAIGRRFGRSFGREFSALGAVLLTFTLYGALSLLPTAFGLWGIPLGLLLSTGFFLAVQVPALGLLVLTRVGTRRIANATPAPAAALATPR